MAVIDQFSPRRDPFGPACATTGFGVAASLLVARERLLAAVRRGDPLTVLAGRPGMGKTLLLGMIEQACRADGIEVRTVARGDMAHTALGGGAELLLIDEADTINAATLKALAPGTAEAAAPMMVLAASQPALHRISSDVRTTIVDLRPLDPEEAREFLVSRVAQSGRVNLFTPEALDIIVDAGRGSPRLLRVLAGAAMFQAASDGLAQIMPEHASLAATMQGSLFTRAPAEPALPVPANDLGPPVDAEDRPRALVPPLLRPLSRGRAGALAVAASVALTALVMPVFFLPEPTSAPSMGVPSANAASAVSDSARAAASAFAMAPANATVPIVPLKESVRTDVALRAASTTAPPLIAAPVPRVATAAIEARAPSIPPIVANLVADALPVTHAVRPEVEMGGGRSLLIDLLAATRLRPAVAGSPSSDGSQGPASRDRSGAMAQPAATLAAATLSAFDEPPPPVMLVALSPAPTAAPFSAFAAPATQSPASAKEITRTPNERRGATPPLEIVKPTSRSAIATEQAADSSRLAKASADEASAARQAARQATESARQAEAAKEAADQAMSSREAAHQAKAAKESSEQAKAARDAADQAKTAKAASEQAKAAKGAADQAKAAKEAAEQAKAGKDAADQAKVAKDAADQAKAAKDAADQAKAAKDAADQAKAAKEAADQAKAAKGAADQAKAAKEAAEQAKAAKHAVDQAKAAKDAADQAKAAKDAANQAKAAKDAASQAKAAKEAADAAKEAAKAAKDAAKAAKDAAKAGKGN